MVFESNSRQYILVLLRSCRVCARAHRGKRATFLVPADEIRPVARHPSLYNKIFFKLWKSNNKRSAFFISHGREMRKRLVEPKLKVIVLTARFNNKDETGIRNKPITAILGSARGNRQIGRARRSSPNLLSTLEQTRRQRTNSVAQEKSFSRNMFQNRSKNFLRCKVKAMIARCHYDVHSEYTKLELPTRIDRGGGNSDFRRERCNNRFFSEWRIAIRNKWLAICGPVTAFSRSLGRERVGMKQIVLDLNATMLWFLNEKGLINYSKTYYFCSFFRHCLSHPADTDGTTT